MNAPHPGRGPAGRPARPATDTAPPRPGVVPTGAEPWSLVRIRQPREARASFQVADGRMTAAALAGSGW